MRKIQRGMEMKKILGILCLLMLLSISVPVTGQIVESGTEQLLVTPIDLIDWNTGGLFEGESSENIRLVYYAEQGTSYFRFVTRIWKLNPKVDGFGWYIVSLDHDLGGEVFVDKNGLIQRGRCLVRSNLRGFRR